jgi:hypothetical protein
VKPDVGRVGVIQERMILRLILSDDIGYVNVGSNVDDNGFHFLPAGL